MTFTADSPTCVVGEQAPTAPLPTGLEHKIESMATYFAETYELPPQTFIRGLTQIAHAAIDAHMEDEKRRNQR